MTHISRFKSLWIIFALLCLSLPAIQPFLKSEMPRTNDGNLHLYRAIVLDHSLSHDGAMYPRYSSGLVFGYGSALFNYFPPTSYYPTVIFHRLGMSFIQAWNGSMILFLWMATGGAYLLGQIWTDERGGFITAAAYLYSPYLIFDAVTRGTSSEVAALSVLPIVLWAFMRLAFRGQRIDFFLAVFSFAIFIPLHNIITLHGTVFIGLYCAFLWLTSSRKIQVFLQLFLAGLVAVVMTTFFWLPALAETSATKINAVAENLNFVDVTNSLYGLSRTLSLPHTADPTQLQQQIPISLGWVQIILGVVGLILLWMPTLQPKRQITILQSLLFGIVLSVIFLQMPQSAIIWENVPLIGFSQFAWRLLGIGSLASGLMAGIGAVVILDRMPTQTFKIGLFCVFTTFVVLYSTSWLYTAYTPIQANSISDAQNYERQTGELSLSSYSEYLPVDTLADSLDTQKLQDLFAQADVIPRLTPLDGVTVLDAQWQGTSVILEIDSQSPNTLVFDWLYVPGWSARFLDEPLSLAPLTARPILPQGFVGVDIPAGHHRLEVALYRTRLQQISEWVSFGGIGLLGLILLFGRRFWKSAETFSVQSADLKKIIIATISISLIFFALKNLVIDRISSPFKTSRFVDGQLINLENALNLDFGGKIRLLGYVQPNRLKSGEMGEIRVFWTLLDDDLDTDYSSTLQIRDSQQNIIVQSGSFYPGNLATSNWQSGYYVEDVITIDIPDFTPPATYSLHVGLFNPETQVQLNLLNETGNPIGVFADVGTLEIIRPEKPTENLPSTIGSFDGLNLLEIEGVPQTAQVGDEMTIRWLWQLVEKTESNQQAQLVWLDENQNIVGESPFVNPVHNFPIGDWQTGDVWRGVHRLYVPANLEGGVYQVGVRSEEIIIPVGEMQVGTPERNYDLPDVEYSTSLTWENGIQLRGYSDTVTGVTVYWQTTESIQQNLRLFVQVVDSNDSIVALTDGIPVDWTRPTTSWDVGEIITTEHRFGDLPAGEYRVRIGWYDPISNQRIMLDNGDDSTFLPEPFMVE